MVNPVETRHADVPDRREDSDGSLGYVSSGIFTAMYGPLKKVKDVGHVTVTYEEGRECFAGAKGIGVSKFKARGTADVMDNLLFSCEDDPKDINGLIFIQQPWPTDGEDIIVRALHPGALRGEGLMVLSNLSRVYVINATLPRHAKRGYLAVEKIAMVEAFLKKFYLESRFGGYMDSETDDGNRAPSFVVEDKQGSKGYYITARPSREDPTRIICHLKKRARRQFKKAFRAVNPFNGPDTLTHWVRDKFPDAQTLLFD